MVTAGATSGLAFITQHFGRTGVTVYVEDPTFFVALCSLREWGLRVVAIPTDSNGMRVDILEEMLLKDATDANLPHCEHGYKALVYTIPTFQNPSGTVMADDRRRRLVEIAKTHSLLVISDDVYDCLTYAEGGRASLPPRLSHYDTDGKNVISNGSFSKLFGPGLRLGWIECGRAVLDELKASASLNSSGSMNHVTSGIMHAAMESGLAYEVVKLHRSAYSSRRDALAHVLRTELPPGVTFEEPQGGMFLWVFLPEGADAEVLLKVCIERHHVKFQPGRAFSPSGGCRRCVRLSFAPYTKAVIVEGGRRFCMGVRDYLAAITGKAT